MNLTSIERKNINKFSNIYKNLKEENNINNDKKGINLRKIEQKKFGMRSTIGSLNNNFKSSALNTISLSSKLSDISEKLEKYENLVSKLGKEYQ